MSQERMVNLAFVAAALIVWFLSAHLFAGLFDLAGSFDLTSRELDMAIIGHEFRLSNLLGMSVGIIGGIALWRSARLFQFAHEVAGELRKVTWPSVAETRLLTGVVMVTTVLVSGLLWMFDSVISVLTRLIYKI